MVAGSLMRRLSALFAGLALVALIVGGLAEHLDIPPSRGPMVSGSGTETSPGTEEIVLRSRETLDRALGRAGVGGADAADIVAALRRVVDLRRLRPGERLIVRAAGNEERAQTVTHWRSPAEGYEATRGPAGWTAQAVRVAVDTRVVAVTGQLVDSLFASVERLGETAALTARFVGLLEWDFDFAADSLPGDRFRLLVEKRYVGDEFVGYGDILVAEYRSAERPALLAVAFTDPEGRTQHYDAAGRSVRKMFLRAPLDFTRITSGFSHARRHPILGGLRPHLAIDYGAPVGTPVRAVAEGVV
ncbi:MAG: M23 family metallopeptidase, partial [Candidatus Rokubacteria bacterium]|nr:M23 family metallopeptidase [Candidatus Rokubacteria bacterium]